MPYFLRAIAIIISIISALNLHSQTTFTEKAQDIGIDHVYEKPLHMGGGAAWFDYNNDGWEDVYITAGINQDELFKNNGDGTFTEVGVAAGIGFTKDIVTNGVVTGDIDNDGDRDILVTTFATFPNILLENNGDGTFLDITLTAGLINDTSRSMIATFGDVNLDGYLDIYIGNYVAESGFIIDTITFEPVGFDHICYPNFFYINNGPDQITGKITFTESSNAFGVRDSGCALATAFTDFDGDRDMDILLANDFGEWGIPNRLFENENPSNSFSEIGQAASMDAEMYGMGIAIGDYDQDLDLDYYITNIGRNGLFQNQGDGTFLDIADTAGVDDTNVGSQFTVGWGTEFMDVDNDADLDLFVTNGFVPAFDFIANPSLIPDRLFLNDGNNHFVDDAVNAGMATEATGRGSACADYDKDGDMDYIMVPVSVSRPGDPKENVELYRNDLSNNNHWLQVKFEGVVSNRDAFGTQVKIVLSDRSWLHEVSGGSSHASQNSSIAHFGLGNNTQVDSLIISWPGWTNGNQQVLTNITANQLIEVLEDTSLYIASIFSPEELMAGLTAYPNPSQNSVKIAYQLFKKSSVELNIYNQMGQHIITLEKKIKGAGEYEIPWGGFDKNGRKTAAGLYFVKLNFGQNRVTIPIQFIN